MNLYDFLPSDDWNGPHRAIQCKRALSPSKLFDFALNPYSGCEHGCVYCYAPEVTHNRPDDWRVVKVKINIVDRLSKELRFAEGSIGIGTVTDPYQRAESRFGLTRDCLKVLRAQNRKVQIFTKSDLVTRDIDILGGMDVTVGMTITGLDDRVSKITEPGAPIPKKRLDALRTLVEEGIDTFVLAEPILSHNEGFEKEFVDAIYNAGTRAIEIGGLNHRQSSELRLARMGIYPASDECINEIRNVAKGLGMSVKDIF